MTPACLVDEVLPHLRRGRKNRFLPDLGGFRVKPNASLNA